MRKRITEAIHRVTSNFLSGVKRFPEAVIFAVATVMLLIVMNHWQTPDQTTELLTRIAMTLALGFPVALSLNELFTRTAIRTSAAHHIKQHSKTLINFSLTLVALSAYYFWGLSELSSVTISKYLAYSLAAYLAFLFIPYLSNRMHFESYVILLFTRFCTTYLYSVTLYLGLSAILFTIEHLFTVEISGKLYFDLWLMIAGIFAPVYFLAEIPAHSLDDEQYNYPNVLKVLFIYILIPIISVYTIILYAYFAKIIITLTWPIGLVSHLVLWYAMFSALLIFCIFPLGKQNQIAKKFINLFPWLILPLIAIMFVSMGKRITAYGLTENRYYVLVTGLWVTAWMLYYCFAKRPRNIVLPVTLSIIAVLAVSGPWSSFTVSKISQNRRLIALLNKYELLEESSIIPRTNLPGEAKKEINSIIKYFDDKHSLKDISLLPPDFGLSDMEKTFGFKYTHPYNFRQDGREYFSYRLTSQERILSLNGYEVFVDFSDLYTDKKLSYEGIYEFSYSSPTKVLVITEDERELYKKNITDLLSTAITEQDIPLNSAQRIITTDENENLSLLYLFKNIRGWKDSTTGEFEVDWADFYLLVKEK